MTTKDEAVAAAKRIKFEDGTLGPARDILAMAEYLLSAEAGLSAIVGDATDWAWIHDRMAAMESIDATGEPVAVVVAEAATNEQGG